MAGGRKTHRHVADPHVLAQSRRLSRLGEILAVAERHDQQRLAGRQHGAVAGPGVVGMAVRDQRPVDRAHRIDVKIAKRAIETLRGLGEDLGRAQCHGSGI